MFLILQFSWLEKVRKKQFKSHASSRLLKFLFFSKPSCYPPPPPRLLVFGIFSNPLLSPPPSIRDLRVTTLRLDCDIIDILY